MNAKSRAPGQNKAGKITSSIYYAKQIQDTLLKSQEAIRESFQDAFVFYQPKDIVSGDFYWFDQISKIQYNRSSTRLDTSSFKIFVVADCTGHGVAGAFMTMMGSALLNEIVKCTALLTPATF
ncbi:MAG: hypothetical protein HC880_10820 [Bacteroidia bacterium]|nr:hypothetical protein [Bacteroidia bacterium]